MMMDFDDFVARLGIDDSLLTDSVLLAAEAAFHAAHKIESSVYDYGLTAVGLLPGRATPFEKGLACGMAMVLVAEPVKTRG